MAEDLKVYMSEHLFKERHIINERKLLYDKVVNSNSFSELVTTVGGIYDRNVKEARKNFSAFIFNFHLDCGKHFVTFSKEMEIAQICLEGKMCDLLAIFNYIVHCFFLRETDQVNRKHNIS